MYKDFKLLVDGKQAFPQILKRIDEAKKSIKINMFIFRYDNIGCKIANPLYLAANRGVKVYLSMDKYGVILESAEESKQSFFHKKVSLFDKLQILTLRLGYPTLSEKGYKSYGYEDLLEKISNHPNISLDIDRVKKDHSKYYIFDDEILIFGGINVEDKENGSDVTGRLYQDYMIEVSGSNHVSNFIYKLNNNVNLNKDYYYGMNYKENGSNIFEMKDLYIDLINESNEKLIIIMPYFHDVKEVTKAIINAYKRGVEITLMVPKLANFQSSANHRCMKKLMKLTDNNINLYFSNKMVHTKLIVTEKIISLGSTNIANKSFNVLSELNIFMKNVECEFSNELFSSIDENISLSEKVTDFKSIKYNKFVAFLEGKLS